MFAKQTRKSGTATRNDSKPDLDRATIPVAMISRSGAVRVKNHMQDILDEVLAGFSSLAG